MYERTTDLKKINPNLKILIAVGGWNFGSGPFSDMVNNEALRKNFVATSVEFLTLNKFDGLDLEYIDIKFIFLKFFFGEYFFKQ